MFFKKLQICGSYHEIAKDGNFLKTVGGCEIVTWNLPQRKQIIITKQKSDDLHRDKITTVKCFVCFWREVSFYN